MGFPKNFQFSTWFYKTLLNTLVSGYSTFNWSSMSSFCFFLQNWLSLYSYWSLLKRLMWHNMSHWPILCMIHPTSHYPILQFENSVNILVMGYSINLGFIFVQWIISYLQFKWLTYRRKWWSSIANKIITGNSKHCTFRGIEKYDKIWNWFKYFDKLDQFYPLTTLSVL